jgi:hypothetical protein
LQLVDWISASTYSVFPLGINDPTDGDRQLVIDPEDKTASPIGWHDQGSVSRGRGDDGNGKFLGTVGNNVWAQVRLNFFKFLFTRLQNTRKELPCSDEWRQDFYRILEVFKLYSLHLISI